jgi:hypothetical protein
VFTFGSARPLAVIDLEPHPGGTYMMTVKAVVNGQEGRFMFDTGGGISYISPDFAKRAGCDPWGQITGFMLTGQRLDMPRCDRLAFDVKGLHLAAPSLGVYDIGKFMPPNTPAIDGSLALDVFANSAITLSLAHKRLTVESASSLRESMKKGTELPIRLVREAEGLSLSIVAAVQTQKGTAWMEIDSGNGGAHVIGKHMAPIFGLDTEKKEPQSGRLTFANGIQVDGPFRVNPTLTMDGNIGTRFLINWDLTLDLASGRGWLTSVKN